MASWTFGNEEFAALWFGPANDRMLYPLSYLSRFSHLNERDAYWAAVRHDWSEQGLLTWAESDALSRAFTVLGNPEAWAEVHGIRDDTGPIRIAAARHARQAALAVQFTEDEQITVQLIAAERLPAVLAGLLPKCPPGRGRPQRFTADDLRPDRTPRVHRGQSTPLDRYHRLLRRPSTGAGVVTVFRGPRHRGRAPLRKIGTVRWYDISDDGRYLETGIRTRTVRPGDTGLLQAMIARLIDVAMTEYHEYIDELGEFAQ